MKKDLKNKGSLNRVPLQGHNDIFKLKWLGLFKKKENPLSFLTQEEAKIDPNHNSIPLIY